MLANDEIFEIWKKKIIDANVSFWIFFEFFFSLSPYS
jgi:hypothetical protein